MTMMMKALWCGDRSLSLRTIPVPQPSDDDDDEVLVRVVYSGICGTDLQLLQGYYPYDGVLGHEFVGIDTSTGNRVCAHINFCNNHNHNHDHYDHHRHCDQRRVVGIKNANGCHAEYILLPRRNLVRVPDAVSNEDAVFAEPLAAALRVMDQVHIHNDTRVLVLGGGGRLGQLIAWTLRRQQAHVDVALRTARERQVNLLRARHVNVIKTTEIVDRSYDVVVECTGNSEGWEMALNAVKPMGCIVMKSTYAGALTMNMARVVVDEIRVVGSRCGSIEAAMRAIEDGLRPSDLIDHIYGIDEYDQAFKRMQNGNGVLKLLFKYS